MALTDRELSKLADLLVDGLTDALNKNKKGSTRGEPEVRSTATRDYANKSSVNLDADLSKIKDEIKSLYSDRLAALRKSLAWEVEGSDTYKKISANIKNLETRMNNRIAKEATIETLLDNTTDQYRQMAYIVQNSAKKEEAIGNATNDRERIIARAAAQEAKALEFEKEYQIARQKEESGIRALKKEGLAQQRQLNIKRQKYNLEVAKEQAEDSKSWLALSKLKKKELEQQGASQKKLEEVDKEILDAKNQLKEANKNANKAALESFGSDTIASLKENNKLAKAIFADDAKERGQAISSMLDGVNNEISGYIKDAMSHRVKIMARLQGAGEGGGEFSYDNLLDLVAANLGASPYVQQQKYLQNLDTAVQAGIAYNVEQRTFLQTIAEDISGTFNAFNAELLRLIKLQQADSTAARLGMEAAIQRGLNQAFQDSSYMGSGGSGMYQAVSGALLGAESLMSRNEAVEFEYMVQKWLGALYSLGMSDSAVQMIASAINALGTGDISSLAGNTPMQTLFAMSSSRAGIDYARALTDGLSAAGINDLLRSMVEYLQQIAEESGNNVVRSAYKDLYSMTLSDMKAVSSLTEKEIEQIYGSSMSYTGAEGELNTQMANLWRRFSMAEMTQNLIANFKYGIGADIASTPWQYVTWQLADMIRNTTGGIHLPAISVFGNMIDLSSFTIEGIMQSAMVGISTISQIASILGGLGNMFFPTLSPWGGTETTQRGGFIGTTSGFDRQISQSQYIGSSSSQDIKNESLSSATEEAGEVAEITNAGNEPEHTFDDFYNAVYVEGTPLPVSIEAIGRNGDEVVMILVNAIRMLSMSLSDTMNVNITGSDAMLPVALSGTSPEIANSYKTFNTTELAKAIAKEIKTISLGYSSRDEGEMVADAIRKLIDGDTEVKVTKIFDTTNARSFGKELVF